MTNQKTIDRVILFLGLAALVLILGAFALLLDDKSVPETIWTLIGTTIGALASLLVSTRTNALVTDVPAAVDTTNKVTQQDAPLPAAAPVPYPGA